MPLSILVTYLVILCASLLLLVMSLIVLLQVFLNIPPYFPSLNRQIKRALLAARAELEEAKPNKKLKFIDLGSGDGRIVFMAAKLGFEAHGVEINPILWTWCTLQSLFYKNRPKFHLGSYFQHELKGYDLVFTYLFPHTMQELEEKIFAELTPGSLAVSNQFKFNRQADKELAVDIHLYRA